MEKSELPLVEEMDKQPNLEMIVNDLQRLKNDYVNWYFDFLGHKLYSDDVSVEDAYLEVYNMTYAEYMEQLRENYNKYKASEIVSFKKIIKERYPDDVQRKTEEYLKFIKDEEKNKTLEERLNIFDRELTCAKLVCYYLRDEKEVKKTK